jgi:hypothetical protein
MSLRLLMMWLLLLLPPLSLTLLLGMTAARTRCLLHR